MDNTNYQHSPFLSDLNDIPDPSASTYTDFNSPAAPGSPNLNLNQNSFNHSAPATPFTPSFAGANAGSYAGSPRGSDISYIPGNEFQSPHNNNFPGGEYGDFSIDIDVFPPVDDYDPSIYDAPADNSTLLFSNDFMASLTELQKPHSSPSPSPSSPGSPAGVSVSVMPAPDDEGTGPYGTPFDHGSPASSNGDMDQLQRHGPTRSRGSSISSVQGQGDFSSSSLGLEHVHIDQTSTPSWAGSPNLQSPPQLFIPGGMPEITNTSTSPVPSPTIPPPSLSGGSSGVGLLPPGNIGSNKGLMPPDGPGIEIVPATPVSAGTGAHASRRSNFGGQDTSSIQAASKSQSQNWGRQPPQVPSISGNAPSPFSFPSIGGQLTPPPTGGITNIDINLPQGANLLGINDSHGARGAERSGQEFYIPIEQQIPRNRSKSDTSTRLPNWTIGFGSLEASQHQENNPNISTRPLELPQLPRLNEAHSASFGPPISGTVNPAYDPNISASATSSHFLSPDYVQGGLGSTELRRSRSEYGHRRNALSADMRPIFADDGNALAPAMNQQFMNRGSAFLSPNLEGGGMSGTLDNITLSGSGIGAHRRSHSHGSHGHSRSLSRERLSASPYPSPHASPRGIPNDLPDVYGFSGPLHARQSDVSIPVHVMGVDAQGRTTVQSQAPIQVARQQVTTIATADASQRRRRTEASFTCPVPGCGSTFTRHFNLKGHLRSHNEERPFKCKWPGCDKGFARQHDCKRHENLHQNLRPYNCKGCERQFARMDALNRHLRSDAGSDCQAKQPMLTSSSSNDMEGRQLHLKSESSDSWQPSSSSGSVMV